MSTQRYLFIRRNSAGKQAPPPPQPTPAQLQDMHAAFNVWQGKYSAAIVDIGGRLKASGKVVHASEVTDGPFAEAKELVGGFMIVSAESYEGAVQIARDMPGLWPGASIEIREIAT